MLSQTDERQPSATLVLGEDGPGLAVTTAQTGDPGHAQRELVATHVDWLAQQAGVPPGQVVGEVLEALRRRRASDDVVTVEFEHDHDED